MKVHFVLLSISLSLYCSAEDAPAPPSIRFNSHLQPDQTQKALTAGSTIILSCSGSGPVHWTTTAFNLMYQDKLGNPLEVSRSDPRHTGTYTCGYANQSLSHLNVWIHLYVNDPSNTNNMFVTSRNAPEVREGEDFLFRCLLTDPTVSDLTLQPEDDRGQGLPTGMTVTLDPKRGALIRDLQRTFTGHYVCSGWKGGVQFKSRPLDLVVFHGRPPSVFISKEESVALEGEKFEVTCLSINPTYLSHLTWTHSKKRSFNVTEHQHDAGGLVHTSSTLSISAVQRSHSGNFTCIIHSESGDGAATGRLKVLDAPYLNIYLKTADNISSTPEANSSKSGDAKLELIANVTLDAMNNASRANISRSSMVEAYEGYDVTLTFVFECYPSVIARHWSVPIAVSFNNSHSSVHLESYTTKGTRSEARLLLRRVRLEDRGRYQFQFFNAFFSGSLNVDLRIYRSPSTIITVENNTLTCSTSGYPLPTVLLYTCPGIQDTCGNVSTYQVSQNDMSSQWSEEAEQVKKSLPLSPADDVTVECVAFNHMAMSRQIFKSGGHEMLFTPSLIGAVSTAGILLLMLLVALYKWKQKPKYEIRWKIIESTDGNNYTFVDPTQLPYNYKWEFPRDKLRLGAVLGSGAFGKVVEATAYGLGNDDVMRVAVKMLKPSAHSEEREALMSELKILGYLGNHDNIVNLLGACTQGGPMLMITEYCSHGDLLNFLRAHAHDFMASMLSFDEGKGLAVYKNMASVHARLRSDSGISCCSDYQEMQPVLGRAQQGEEPGSLSIGDLMRFSQQVAQGLDFLSTRNCIHRDVAARNVLLTDHRVAKICDFGLARDIRNDDSYIVQGNARLPVKWMSPESIFQCVYTVQSDVWSYGVLLWEIFSMGKSPYPNVAVDTNFYKMIQDGFHMTRPDFAPPQMYELMTLCWSLEPTDRPTFKLIGQLIDQLLQSSSDTSPHRGKQLYRNMTDCKEEEVGDTLKGGDDGEERRQTERHDDQNNPVTKNIYQLS
ncbi:macrophage colony-stimulating factor 1 receptor 2 [Nelusetta ayraudi]|uniref:macrophage colony-stimulating factor 1 receptor 2 n=1 Tax=Nelusetta ayraudi TaxID=303726 RepID=UPI003F71A4A1